MQNVDFYDNFCIKLDEYGIWKYRDENNLEAG